MRFSIYLNPQTRGPEEDVPIIETTVEQALRATRAGVQGIALTEHHFSGYNTYGNNFLLAAHLSAQVPADTTFLLACAVPPLHNPMRLAQNCNLLDILTKGNLIVAFAAGGSPVEYAGMGREPSERHEQMLHNLEVMERALAKRPDEPPYEWSTAFEHGSLRTRIMPAAYRDTGPRFARATQSDDGVVWTGRKGWYLFTARETEDVIASRLKLYTESLADAGYDDEFITERLDWSLVQKQVIVGETDAAAVEFARERMAEMGAHQKKNFTVTGDIKDSNQLKSVVGVSPQNPDEFLERAMIVGSPETVRQRIADFGAVGVQHMSLLFNFGFMTAAESGRSLDLFLDEVLPAFTPAAAGSGRA
ncbi:MAG TPA: LLM class flavin-dependent oxidoreductase [Pseudonocardiaceae bacterium]|jgi:alkanesulfonate monooxygenase SsuD/methylene tetrahydromethanopterin reductase-like flavin-dependent oxidoreductase (luciferase family)|nr:LLM class flavin-dependent oxidoreductase [Pseudonocardiaceae bacterium]